MNILLTTCENPNILRLIYLAKKISNLVFILIPIALIIFVIIDVFKNVVEADNEKNVKTNNKSIIKRIVYAILIFFTPMIVSLIMNTLSLVGLNSEYKKCIDNATKEKIAEYQKIYDAEEKKKDDERKNNLKNPEPTNEFSHSGGKF